MRIAFFGLAVWALLGVAAMARSNTHEVSVAGRLEDGREFAIRVPVELEQAR